MARSMMHTTICPTCGVAFESRHKRKYCCQEHRASITPEARAAYEVAANPGLIRRPARRAARELNAARYRQRRASGESLASIAASEGVSRQRIHQLTKGEPPR